MKALKYFTPATLFLVCAVLLFQNSSAQSESDTIYLWDFSVPDSIPELLSDSTTGDWQIGIPQKAFFGNAASGSYAIMTDTLHPYTPDTTSSFILRVPNHYPYPEDPYPLYSTTLCFKHKLEAPQDSAFAQIAFSIDQGQNWYDYTNDPTGFYLTEGVGFLYYGENWGDYWHSINNDSLYGFTGIIEPYAEMCVGICWEMAIFHDGNTRSMSPDTIWVKFTFIADSNVSDNAGWIIDDIRHIEHNWCGSGVEEYHLPPLEIRPQPAGNYVRIYKPGNLLSSAKLEIFNAIGKRIRNISFETSTLTLETQSWSSGLYTYVLTDDGIPVNKGKIIVVH